MLNCLCLHANAHFLCFPHVLIDTSLPKRFKETTLQRCNSLSPLDVVVLRVLGWSSSCQIFKIFKAEQFSAEASFLFFNSASEKRSRRQLCDGRLWSSIIILIIAIFFSTPTSQKHFGQRCFISKYSDIQTAQGDQVGVSSVLRIAVPISAAGNNLCWPLI